MHKKTEHKKKTNKLITIYFVHFVHLFNTLIRRWTQQKQYWDEDEKKTISGEDDAVKLEHKNICQ